MHSPCSQCKSHAPHWHASALQLGDVPVGSKMSHITFCCFDEGGRQTPRNDNEVFSGKASCGWMRKARKAVLQGAGCTIFLPTFDVGTQVRTPCRATAGARRLQTSASWPRRDAHL